jgi:hypothetical protein
MLGANVHGHQAIPGDIQPTLPQVNCMPGDTNWMEQAIHRTE